MLTSCLLWGFLCFQGGEGSAPKERIERAIADGKLDEATKLLASWETTQPAPSPAHVAYLKGSLAFHRGQKEQAIALFQSALEQEKNAKPADPRLRGDILHRLGFTYARGQQLEKARDALSAAYKEKKAQAGLSLDSLLRTLHALADCEESLGNLDAAIAYGRHAADLVRQSSGEKSLDAAFEQGRLIQILAGAGRLEEAAQVLAAIQPVLEPAATKDARFIDYLEQRLTLELKKRNADTSFSILEVLEERVRERDGAYSEAHIHVVLRLCDLAHLKEESWQAQPFYRELLAHFEAKGQMQRFEAARVLYGMGKVLMDWNNHQEARDTLVKVRPYSAAYGSQWPNFFAELESDLRRLDELLAKQK
jgi:hypothetical protein